MRRSYIVLEHDCNNYETIQYIQNNFSDCQPYYRKEKKRFSGILEMKQRQKKEEIGG